MTDQPTTAADSKPKPDEKEPTPHHEGAEVTPEVTPASTATVLHGSVFKVGEAPQLATTSDTANTTPLEIVFKAAPQLDNKAVEQKVKELHDAIHRGGWFFGLNSSPDKEAIGRILEPLTKADREAIEKVYAQKYPEKGATALRTELKQILDDDLQWRKFEAVLNREDGRTNDAGNVMVALTHMQNDPRAGNAELRAAISTLNSHQISQMRDDFKSQYNMSLDDALKNGKIDQQTREALGVLLKGSDKRDADDQVTMANLAVNTFDRRLFAEALRGDGPAATEARARLQQDQGFKDRMGNAFPSKLALDPDLAMAQAIGGMKLDYRLAVEQSAQDYLAEGRISLKTIAEGNTGMWIFDNKDNVELAARNAGDKERQDFTLGRDIATANPPRQPASDAEREALNFYNKLHGAFKANGNARDVAIWEDNLINGKPTVVNEMARTHKDGYVFGLFGSGHSRQEIISAAENLSQKDWETLRSDKGDAFLKQIDESLQGYADPGERQRIMEILKGKRDAPTYEQSQQVHRTIKETIDDNQVGFMGNPAKLRNLIPNMVHMSAQDAADYQKNPAFLDKFVEDNMHGVEQVYARRLLDQVKQTGQPPKEGAIERMFSLDMSQQIGKYDKAPDILRAAEQAMRDDPQLKARLDKPWDQLTREEKIIRIVVQSNISGAIAEPPEYPYFSPKIEDTWLKTGRFTPEQQLHMGYPRKDVIPELATAPQADRDATARFLNDGQKQVLQEIMKNPDQKPSLADRMRLFIVADGRSGEGVYSDFKDELQGLTYEQRQHLKEEYQSKYGNDFDNQFLSKVDEKDRGLYKDLLTPASLDGRQRFFDNYLQMIKSDSGFSADVSKLTVERASDLHAVSLEDYQRVYQTLPLEKQQALDAFFGDALKQYKDSKEKLAEVLVDATITATALAAMPFTGGASMAAVVSIAAASGAAFRVAAMRTIVGTDYDTDKVFADLVKGGTTAALNFLTFGVGNIAGKVGGNVAEKMLTTFGDDVISQAGRQLLKTELPGLLAKYGTDIPEQEMKALIARLAAEGATPAQRAALEKAMRDGVTNGWTTEMNSLLRLAKDSARSAAEGGLANAGGEVAYALVDPKYDFSNLPLSAGVGIVVGALMPIGIRGLRAGKDAIVNFRVAGEGNVPGRAAMEIHPADQTGPVTIKHADGSTTTLKPGEANTPYHMKPGDQIVEAPAVPHAPRTVQEYNPRANGGDTAARPEAVRQSNAYEQQRELWEPIENGWQRAGSGAEIHPDGRVDSRFPATVVDRTQDKVLNETINDAMQRYQRLAEDAAALSKTNPTLAAQKYQELSQQLAEFSRNKMQPRGWNDQMVDTAYNQFYDTAGGRRVLLGDFIDQAAHGTGAGACSQQAVLFKVLVDELNARVPGFQMRAGLVHGNYGDPIIPGRPASLNHAWNEVEINGQRYVYDSRQQRYGVTYDQVPDYHPGRDLVSGPSTAADANFDLRQKLKPNETVMYDGREWKVQSVTSDGALISQNGLTSNSITDFMKANPGRRLEIGQRYSVMRANGQKEDGWMFQGYNQDGSARFFKEDAIRTRVTNTDLVAENARISSRHELATGKVEPAEIAGVQQTQDIGDLAYRIQANNQPELIPALRAKILERVNSATPAEYLMLRQSAQSLNITDDAFRAAMRQREQQLVKENLVTRVIQEHNPTRDVYTGSVRGFDGTRIMAKTDGPGNVILTHMYRGDLSPGMGADLLAETLRAHKILPTKSLTLSMINEQATRDVWMAGGRPENTVLGRSITRALQELGIKPKSMEWVVDKYHSLSVVIKME